MTTKELEIQGCRTFVCPNLSLIDEKGRELNLSVKTVDRAKSLAIEYFKKTYHKPHYSSAKHLLPAFVYAASILEGERRTQADIAGAFGVSHCTIRKWHNEIRDTLGIDVMIYGKRPKSLETETEKFSYHLDIIDTTGKALNLKDTTIEKAKDLAVRYFEKTPFYHYYPYIKQLLPAFIYTASVIENDWRRQFDICEVSGVAEALISKWHRDIIRTLGMKIISNNMRVIAVLENQYDN